MKKNLKIKYLEVKKYLRKPEEPTEEDKKPEGEDFLGKKVDGTTIEKQLKKIKSLKVKI